MSLLEAMRFFILAVIWPKDRYLLFATQGWNRYAKELMQGMQGPIRMSSRRSSGGGAATGISTNCRDSRQQLRRLYRDEHLFVSAFVCYNCPCESPEW